GDLMFTTSTGGLWRIQPGDGPAKITSLGRFHPDGPSYPSVLLAFKETSHICGLARTSKGTYEWVIYDLDHTSSKAIPVDLTAFSGKSDLLLYGTNTRDREGHGYAVGKSNAGPVCFKLE